MQIDRGHKLISSWFEFIKTGSLAIINIAKIMLCKQEHRQANHWVQFSALLSAMQWAQAREDE